MSGPFTQAGICLLALMEFADEVLIFTSNTMVHLPYRVFLATVQPVGHYAVLACASGGSCECCESLNLGGSRRRSLVFHRSRQHRPDGSCLFVSDSGNCYGSCRAKNPWYRCK
jgi:hypothetical protein